MWEKSAWIKIIFFALCVALFLFVLQSLCGVQVGRYQQLHFDNSHMQIYSCYIDTATGAIYDAKGRFCFRLDTWAAFWGTKDKK